MSRLLPVSAEFLAACRPDLEDPATTGILMLALREASGDAFLYARLEFRDRAGRRWDDEEPRWVVESGEVWHAGATEAEAVAAALVDLARGGRR